MAAVDKFDAEPERRARANVGGHAQAGRARGRGGNLHYHGSRRAAASEEEEEERITEHGHIYLTACARYSADINCSVRRYQFSAEILVRACLIKQTDSA